MDIISNKKSFRLLDWKFHSLCFDNFNEHYKDIKNFHHPPFTIWLINNFLRKLVENFQSTTTTKNKIFNETKKFSLATIFYFHSSHSCWLILSRTLNSIFSFSYTQKKFAIKKLIPLVPPPSHSSDSIHSIHHSSWRNFSKCNISRNVWNKEKKTLNSSLP